MDFSGLLLLGFLWFLFNLLSRGRSQEQARRRPLPRDPLPPAAPPARGDSTQREGSRLEALLRELERSLNEGASAGPLGRPAPAPLPPAEEVEERQTLEEEPEVVSLEEVRARPERAAVSQDEGAERLVAQRIQRAEARSGALTRADHLAFDERIRRQPADATRTRTPSPEELRRAIVWREILGPPAALRGDE